MTSNAWYDYINQLHTHIQQQDKRIKKLENRIELLESKGQNSQQTTIEKLEYHFDQLKIERLDGTLHIGLSPEDLKKVDDMSISQPNPNSFQKQADPTNQQLASELDSYLMSEGPMMIHQLAQEYSYPLNDAYREMIIHDVRKQLPSRVAHYQKLASEENVTTNERNPFIKDKIKKEIDHSLRLFFTNDQEKGE
ncbi:spore germination protein GerPC [Aquibacillus kalidii]|uniref:spore germination protein GerPC n=1 Tax=Aquibacillus kalidii TaxID=2762597 RepID=UPI00164474B9|nr:spore germination protein GerPC [Aquibacillus kalidii]